MQEGQWGEPGIAMIEALPRQNWRGYGYFIRTQSDRNSSARFC
jgi:hypothetical protein